MTPIRDVHAAVIRISNRWFERDEALWRRWLAFADSRGMTLLALIYMALHELRDAADLAADETGADFCAITWEWREAIVRERLALRQTRDDTVWDAPKCAESVPCGTLQRNPLQGGCT